MRIVRIPKHNGEFRTIYIPNRQEMVDLRRILHRYLMPMAIKACNPMVVHGFMPNRSPVTNAWMHRGFKHTISLDLEDFFDSIKPRGLLSKHHYLKCTNMRRRRVNALNLCLPGGSPRQGLPTSPVIANMATRDLDQDILDIRQTTGFFVYTRYADDITISTNELEICPLLVKLVIQKIMQHGFKVNKRKTRLQHSKNGRRIITGVAVDHSVHPTRKIKRRIRAAKHRDNLEQLFGLEEWAKVKKPKAFESDCQKQQQLFAAKWNKDFGLDE